MGGFDIAILTSLLFGVFGLRALFDVWKNRTAVFDSNVTASDRYALTQISLFVLIPVSVALHELGHAVAIWSFGGKVTGFGFYFFAGYVSYNEQFSIPQELVVTAAGTIVNILIFAVVFGYVLLKRPPLSAAKNELLITFVMFQTANALIFYPMLDFGLGMHGDWSQMYSRDLGNWRWVVLTIHAGLLAGAFGLSRWRAFRLKLGRLTGYPPGVERGLMGGLTAGSRSRSREAVPTAPVTPPRPLTLAEERMVAATKRVASGWNGTVHHQLRSTPSASEVVMYWTDGINGIVRAAVLRALPDGSGELWGLLLSGQAPAAPLDRRLLKRWDVLPDENELTLALRIAMEGIGRWPSPSATKPADV